MIAISPLLESSVRRVRKGATDQVYGKFDMETGACPLLSEEGLCRVQREKGHDVLPFVCRSYPRGESYQYSGYLERSLSPSCEGMLALLWDLPDGIAFRSDPLPREQQKYVSFPEENPLPLYFSVVREWCVDLLQNRRHTLPQRIWIMGLGLKLLADGEDNIDRWMEQAVELPNSDAADILPDGNRELEMFLGSCIRILLNIHIGLPDFQSITAPLLEELNLGVTIQEKCRVNIPLESYLATRARFEKQFADRDYFMENLMVSIFFWLHMPWMKSREELWKGYVNFCNLYAVYRFMSVMSCREGSAGDRDELFRLIVLISRLLLHSDCQEYLRDELFRHDSATLAHMAILLGG